MRMAAAIRPKPVSMNSACFLVKKSVSSPLLPAQMALAEKSETRPSIRRMTTTKKSG